MKKNKKNIVLVVVVLTLVLGIVKALFFKEKAEITEQPKVDQETSFKTVKPATIDKVSPKSVTHVTQNKIVLENKVPVYKINKQKIDEIWMKKTAGSFGFKSEAVVNEENFVIYDNPEDSTRLDINKQTLTVSFSKNLLLNPMIKPMRVASIEEITEKLKGLMVKNLGLGPEIKVKTERVEYEELAGPRFAASTKERGNIVKIVGNYKIDNLPVFSQSGFPVVARFATDGNLLNLSVDLPFNNLVVQGEFSVKNEDELRGLPAKEYTIVDVDGGKDYDLISTEEAVEDVNITDGYLGYIYTPNSNFLSPYIFFKGNSKLSSGPVVVILAVPALKEEEYY